MHIEKSNKTIHELKQEIDLYRGGSKGQLATEDLVQELRRKEL